MSVPDPAFEVLGVEPVAHAASPTLRFTLRVTEAERSLHAIALSAQINIDPARRTYDAETRDAAGRAVRAGRALGLDDALVPVDAGRRAGAASSPAAPTSR